MVHPVVMQPTLVTRNTYSMTILGTSHLHLIIHAFPSFCLAYLILFFYLFFIFLLMQCTLEHVSFKYMAPENKVAKNDQIRTTFFAKYPQIGTKCS